MDRERTALTGTDYWKVMLSDSKPVLTKESLMRELPTSIPDAAHHTSAQSLKLLCDVSVGEISRRDEFERVEENRLRLLDEVNSYRMEDKMLLKTLLENEVVKKVLTLSLVDMKQTVNHAET